MRNTVKSKVQLVDELEKLRRHITQLEKISQKYEREKNKLKESEEKYRKLIEDCQEGIAVVSGLEIKFVNRALLRMFGYKTKKEMIGHKFTAFVSPKFRRIMRERGFAREKGEIVLRTYEFRALRKDGTEFDAELHVSRITYKGEAARQGVIRGITERKKIEEEKEKLQAQLLQSEKMAAIGTLTSGIAHEFNNLLQIMRGHSEFALRTKKAKDIEEALDVVLDSSDKAAKIIGDLLTFSREESPDKKFLNITEEIEDVLALVEQQLRKRNINVLRIYEKVPRVMINKGEMQQVFLNMITNARDAMLPEGGRLEIRVKQVKGNVEVRISDTGGGIPEEDLEKVFDPFFTTKGPVGGGGDLQGAGLGLAVSYGIVKRHDGEIDVESELGKGTTLRVRLPVPGRVRKKVATRRKKGALKGRRLLDILVVDDEEDICKIFRKWLSSEGHRVETVLEGRKALSLLGKEPFDVVFLDVVMPGIPGVEVLEKVKEISPEIKVVMITGSLMEEESWDELREKGASGIIQKPIALEDINKCLASLE